MSTASGLVKDSNHVWTSEEMMHGAHTPASNYICYSLLIIVCYSCSYVAAYTRMYMHA